MRRIAIPLIALLSAACGGGGGGNSGPTEARMNFTGTSLVSATQGNNQITIPPGGRVHYFNTDGVNHHQAVATGANCDALNSKDLAPGADDLRPVMSTQTNCSIADAVNSSITATVFVVTPPPGSGNGGGAGY